MTQPKYANAYGRLSNAGATIDVVKWYPQCIHDPEVFIYGHKTLQIILHFTKENCKRHIIYEGFQRQTLVSDVKQIILYKLSTKCIQSRMSFHSTND